MKKLTFLFAILAVMSGLVSCTREAGNGDTIQREERDMGDRMEDVGDEAGDKAEDVKDKTEDVAD